MTSTSRPPDRHGLALAGLLLGAATLALLVALAAPSWRQIGVWRASFIYKGRGDAERARDHFERAIAAHPATARAHYHLENLLRDQGLVLRPDDPHTQRRLEDALGVEGDAP